MFKLGWNLKQSKNNLEKWKLVGWMFQSLCYYRLYPPCRRALFYWHSVLKKRNKHSNLQSKPNNLHESSTELCNNQFHSTITRRTGIVLVYTWTQQIQILKLLTAKAYKRWWNIGMKRSCSNITFRSCEENQSKQLIAYVLFPV